MTAAARTDELVLFPSLMAVKGPNGGLILTQKFLNGCAIFARNWPGRVRVLLELTDEQTTDMDRVEAQDGEHPFSLEIRPESDAALESALTNVAAVLGFLGPEQAWIARCCHRLGVPIVMTTEVTPTTERQIIDANIRNPLRRLRRKLRIIGAERTRKSMLGLLSGLQCNGTPTFDLYGPLTRNPLLYFDNRVPRTSVVSDAELETRLATLRSGAPIRLVFGGRLIHIKGVMQLPLVASELLKLGLPYTLEICGDGPLKQALEQDVAQRGLSKIVRIPGALDFESGWLPLLRRSADVFLCCHPQGDPSSTYTEVMSCGVPILGYANEAFAGVARMSGSGWVTPMREPVAMAREVVRLAGTRDEIAEHSWRARDYAAAHTFEATFGARARHLFESSRHPDNRASPR